jgi:hypothetical protein
MPCVILSRLARLELFHSENSSSELAFARSREFSRKKETNMISYNFSTALARNCLGGAEPPLKSSISAYAPCLNIPRAYIHPLANAQGLQQVCRLRRLTLEVIDETACCACIYLHRLNLPKINPICHLPRARKVYIPVQQLRCCTTTKVMYNNVVVQRIITLVPCNGIGIVVNSL